MSTRSPFLRYGSSASFVVFAALIRVALAPYVALDVPFITFFIAVWASAWYNGLGPSVFATALSALAATFLFISPFWSLPITSGDLFPVALFCVEALALAYFTHLLQQRTQQAQRGQEQLAASEERLRLAMDGAGMGAWHIELRTGEVRWDAKHGALFGVPDHGLPATVEQFYALIHASDVERIKDAVAAAPTTGIFQEEFRIVRPDGAIRWIAGKGTLLRDGQGNPLRMVGVNYDITERKEAQERTKHFAEELERQVTTRTAELLRSQEQLRALAADLNLAEQRERKRLAAELHDHLAQMLVLVKLKIGQAKHGPAHRTLVMIKQAEQLLNESLTYTRELVAELSPPVLHEFGLPAAIRWLGEQMKRFDLNVMLRIDTHDDLPLPEDQAILLFQSTRELLINVAKHAETKEAVVAVAMHEGTLRITVQDQGVGFVPSSENTLSASSNFSTFGLLSIRERMHALGGRCEIDSAPGQGTRSTLILPFQLSQK
jgi:PAS domain S-box-containing protein